MQLDVGNECTLRFAYARRPQTFDLASRLASILKLRRDKNQFIGHNFGPVAGEWTDKWKVMHKSQYALAQVGSIKTHFKIFYSTISKLCHL